MKLALKSLLTGFSLILVWPLALVAGFGGFRAGFIGASQIISLAPGLIGDYFRTAFYRLTLRSCSLQSRISFGTIFSTPETIIGTYVYIGSYCVIGRARIGDHAQIASHVQILSGARQHARTETGELTGSVEGGFRQVSIGSHSWIGAAAIVMAAVGNPARVLRSMVAVETS
jgi:virginiamycin A acetyltransferase